MRMRTPHHRRLLSVVLLAGLLLPGLAAAKSHKKKPPRSKEFSYYLLVLSYAPDFCAQPQGNKDERECGVGRHVGFIVHGLWPQGETTRGPENCGSPGAVPQDVIDATLTYIPSESLIQHEWTAHGTCSGLSVTDYFATLRKARDSVTLPPELDQPAQQVEISPADLEAKVAAANSSFPATAFRTSCYHDGQLQEIRACLNKDLTPRPCGPSAGECSLEAMTLLPVR